MQRSAVQCCAVQFSAVPGDFFWGLVQPPHIGVRKIEQKFAVPTHCGTAPRAAVVKNCGGITSGGSSGGAEGSRKSRRSRAPPSPERARGPPRWPGAAGRAAPGCARSYPMVLGPGPHYQCTLYEGCMRHNGDHNGYVLICDDPLTAPLISPEIMLERCAPPSYAIWLRTCEGTHESTRAPCRVR